MFISDVDAFRPGGKGFHRRVIHAIHQHRNGQGKTVCTALRGDKTLLKLCVLRDTNVLLLIRERLPAIYRMCFGDIDDIKLRLVPKVIVEFLKVASLATKRWSGVAAEEQH